MTDIIVLDGQNIKAGDTEPDLRLQLIDEGTSKNLTGYTATLSLRNTNSGDVVVNNQQISIDNAKNGVCVYELTSSETEDAGIYEGEVTLTNVDETITFPNDGFFIITIRETIE